MSWDVCCLCEGRRWEMSWAVIDWKYNCQSSNAGHMDKRKNQGPLGFSETGGRLERERA